jgi:hypothetical protein
MRHSAAVQIRKLMQLIATDKNKNNWFVFICLRLIHPGGMQD